MNSENPGNHRTLGHFCATNGGISRVYDAPIEHYEHGVMLYNFGISSQELDNVQRLGLWKASVIFCAMCLDAYWQQIGGASLKSKITDRNATREQKWKSAAISGGVRLDNELVASASRIFEYRNATLHHDTKRNPLLTEMTTAQGAHRAIKDTKQIYAHLHDVFKQQKPALVAWVGMIADKAITPHSPTPP